MKNKVLGLVAAAVLMLALGSMAKADTFDLTVTNGFAPSGVTSGTVAVSGSSTSVTTEFAANTSSLPFVAVVPEPGTLTLLGTGLLGIACFLRRKLLA